MIKLLKKSALALLFMLPLLFTGPKAEASHMMGADITYRCIDTLKFEITLKWYRDCRGISLNGAGAMTVRCSNGSSRTINLSLLGIREITPLCATEPSRCSPSNTSGSGEGVEEHTYRGIVDFNTAPLNALANCTGKIIFGASVNARNGAITTGPNGTLYTDAELDISKAPCNTSPGLTSEPIAVLCCDQPFYFNNGALDTANFDSLSYSWGQPQSGYGTPTTYGGNWAYNNPFTALYPSPAITFPYTQPNADPPFGIYLDPLSGDIVVTPTNCTEVTVAVIVVTEWRANASGVMEEIGKTRRDLQFIVKNCPGNKPPTLSDNYSHNVCEGNQLCFNITTNDQPFPQPTGPLPPPDTVKLDWNAGIAGASFTIIDPTARLPVGRFCWTPPIGSASTLPYTFTATARDDACPLNAVTVRGYRVLVKQRAHADINIDTLACGIYPIRADLPDGFSGLPSYNWSLLDSNRNLILSDKSGYFEASGNFLSNRGSDTLIFRRGGKYIIQLNLNNNPINCPNVFYDTLVVPPLLEADLSIGKDTFVCAGTDIVFRPIITNYNPPLSYQWITMGVENDGTFLNNVSSIPTNDKDTFRLSVPNVQYDTAVGLLIADGSGCTANDTVQVFLKSNPRAVLPPDPRICTYEEFEIVPNLDTAYWIDPDGVLLVQGDTLFKEWYLNSSTIPFSTADSIIVNEGGQYVIRIYDSLGCTDTDTMLLFVNDTVTVDAGPDQTICLNDPFTISASGIDTAGGTASGLYVWYDITTAATASVPMGFFTDTTIVATVNKVYRVQLLRTQDGKECEHSDTVRISVDQLPVLNLGGDENICCDAGPINLNLKVNSPKGGNWFSTTNPEFIVNNEFLTGNACDSIKSPAKLIQVDAVYRYQHPVTGCFNQDSFQVTVNELPVLITQQVEYCQDFGSFKLASRTQGVVISPPNVSFGTPSWKCLDCNSAVNDFENDMLENRSGNPVVPDYWLNISAAAYEIQNPNSDTIVLEFSYRNEFGCNAKDTVNVIVSKVPEILFRDNRDLCHDEGPILLNDLYDLNLRDGVWSIRNEIGFRAPADLGGLTGDSINTLASVPLANANATPNSWLLRYTHTATGCPTFKDTTLRINPLPILNLTTLSSRMCETKADTILTATPAGGTWSATHPPALIGGNMFSPGSSTLFDTPITLYYDYTSAATGCSQVDSIFSSVDLEPVLTLPSDAVFCKPEGNTLDITLDITASNTDSLVLIPFTNTDRINFASTEVDLTTGKADATLTVQNQVADTFLIGANAVGRGSCPDFARGFTIIVNPLPDVTILYDTLEGCDPLTTNFNLRINNDIDSLTSTFSWDLGNGNTTTDPITSAIYSGIPGADISLTVTSAANCSTTVTNNVLVYPIPNARFAPSPSNYTTAALPRFNFVNDSDVEPVNGATIVLNKWDFGDINTDADTSIEENPTWFYSTDTATYCVNLEVTTNHGCENDTTVCVVVGPDLIVYIPNAFTPNQSGPENNEGFNAIISGEKTMELTIFNRWGEIMFQTTERDKQWDGTYKGELAQQDVYAYQLKVTALNDELYTYTGTITLIR